MSPAETVVAVAREVSMADAPHSAASRRAKPLDRNIE
jgi:hypothetical protein